MTEHWKPIDWIDGIDPTRYEVSDQGRVRSWSHPRGRLTKPRLIRGSVDKDGYVRVQLSSGKGNRARSPLHRLVVMAHMPYIWSDLKQREVAHNDGDLTNNHVSNLRWSTHQENIRDKWKHGTMVNGEKHHNAKLSDNLVRVARTLRGCGRTYESIAATLGVSRPTVTSAIAGTTWRHI